MAVKTLDRPCQSHDEPPLPLHHPYHGLSCLVSRLACFDREEPHCHRHRMVDMGQKTLRLDF